MSDISPQPLLLQLRIRLLDYNAADPENPEKKIKLQLELLDISVRIVRKIAENNNDAEFKAFLPLFGQISPPSITEENIRDLLKNVTILKEKLRVIEDIINQSEKDIKESLSLPTPRAPAPLSVEVAEKTSRIPAAVLEVLRELSVFTPASIRSSAEPSYRFGEGPIAPKPPAIHQKTSNCWPARGHIAALHYFSKQKPNGELVGLDLTDHTHGSLPKDAKEIARREFVNHKHTGELYSSNGRICFAKTMPRFKKVKPDNIGPREQIQLDDDPSSISDPDFPGKCKDKVIAYNGKFFEIDGSDPTVTKHYIQETETLRSVLLHITEKVYIIQSFADGILRFSSKDFPNQVFQMDLNSLIEFQQLEQWKYAAEKSEAEIEREAPEIIKNIINFLRMNISKDDSPDSMLAKSVAIDRVIMVGENEQIEPLMVQAGENGNPITGDFDEMNIGLPATLPDFAFTAPNTYTAESEILTNGAKLLRDILTLTSEKKEKKLSINDDLFIKLVPDGEKRAEYLATDYTTQPEYKVFQALRTENAASGEIDPLTMYLQSEWIHQQGRMHIGTYLLNCALNIELGQKMFQHGDEAFNPGDPEEFGQLVHFYKGKIYCTETEEECLNFYLHEPDYLDFVFVHVNPNCLRVRDKPGEPQLTQYWMDLIQIQILKGNGDKIKPETIAAYDALAGENEKISDLINNMNDLDKDALEKEIKKLYQKHNSIPRDLTKNRSGLERTPSFQFMRTQSIFSSSKAADTSPKVPYTPNFSSAVATLAAVRKAADKFKKSLGANKRFPEDGGNNSGAPKRK